VIGKGTSFGQQRPADQIDNSQLFDRFKTGKLNALH